MGRFWKFFGQNYFKFDLSKGHYHKKWVGEFFVANFNKFPYSLRSQGDKVNVQFIVTLDTDYKHIQTYFTVSMIEGKSDQA